MKNLEVIETPSLELVVQKKTVGTLETNITALEEMVAKRLEDYKPENYLGDADLAKKDRAELNKAKDKIKRARIELIKELMKPYSDFEDRCKRLESNIDVASRALDEIVKVKENEEKEQKKAKIELLWQQKNFDLFPLEKVFNSKWLNKTYKESDISNEMDVLIDKTYKDLKSIERFGTDAETLKAHYLISLDLAETISYGDELQRQREVAAREAAERAEREHQKAIEVQKKELVKEAEKFEQNRNATSLAAQALGETEKPERKEFVITVKAFDSELIRIKTALNELGIEFSVEELNF